MALTVIEEVGAVAGLASLLARPWRWEVYEQTYMRLRPGERKTLWDKSASGFLYYFLAATDNPDTVFTVDLHADGVAEIRFTPRQLYEMGLIGGQPGLITLARYDDASSTYVVTYRPFFPGDPFRGRARAWVEAPPGASSTILFLQTWLIVVG